MLVGPAALTSLLAASDTTTLALVDRIGRAGYVWGQGNGT